MSRDFTMVSPAVWRSGRFLALRDSDAWSLFFYYLTCEHQNQTGACRIRDGYAVADLMWTLDRYEKARAALVGAGLILFDPATSEIYVDRWFKHSPPTNQKHAKGVMSLISKIDSDTIREKAEADFSDTQWGAQAAAPEPQNNNRLLDTPAMRRANLRELR